MRPLRILQTESSMELGGQEFATLALTEGLREHGHFVLLLVQAHSRLAMLAQERGIPCQTLVMGKPWYPWAIVKLLSIIRKFNIDIIHTHGSRDSWISSFAAWFSARKPVVVLTRHKTTPISKHWVNRVLYHRLVHSIVTTGGELTRQNLIEDHGFHEEKIVAIPTGADVDRFSPGIDGRRFRNEIGVKKGEYLVGSLCFLRSYKGLDYFIEAAKMIVGQVPQCRFVIVGDGPERERLAEKVQQLGLQETFIMTGYRNDAPEVMAALDVFVVPSTSGETLTQTIPQALAMETPVVATNVGGIPDVIRHGETGFLVPAGDVASLAKHVLLILRDAELGARMAREGRKLVVKSFSSQATVLKNEKLYWELISERSGLLPEPSDSKSDIDRISQ